MKSLGAISLSHKNADLLVRQRISINKNEQEAFISFLKQHVEIKGLIIFSTCNRFEIYYEGEDINPYDIILGLGKYKHLEIDADYMDRFVVFITPDEVAHHLASVALGLQSAIWGDKEVIGQLKSAYQFSLSNKLQGSLLERTIQTVFRIHKQVVNSTDLKRSSESWSYLSLKTIAKHLPVRESGLLLVGAGNIIQETIKYLPKFHFKKTGIINRTNEKAKIIADQHHLEYLNWYDINKSITDFDAVIFGISSDKAIIQKNDIAPLPKKHKVWIDLGMPSNIDPDIKQLPLIELYNLDYFNSIIGSNISDIVSQSLVSFSKVVNHYLLLNSVC